MAPRQTLSDLAKEIEIPGHPENKTTKLILDFMQNDPDGPTRTDEKLASYSEPEIAVLAVEFVKHSSVRLRASRGDLSEGAKKTLTQSHVRDIMNRLIQNRKRQKVPQNSTNMRKASEQPASNFFTPKKTASKSAKSPQMSKKILLQNGKSASAPLDEASELYELSDDEDIFSIADAILSPQRPPNVPNTPKSTISGPEKGKETSRNTLIPTIEFGRPPNTKDQRTSKSPEKERHTDGLPQIPLSYGGPSVGTNLPSQPATPPLNTSPTKRQSLFKSGSLLGKKRTIDEAESVGFYPILTSSIGNTYQDEFGSNQTSEIPSPSIRRVRRRLSRSPSPTPAATSALDPPDVPQLISAHGKSYHIHDLAQIPDTILTYVRECQTKCLNYEENAQPPAKSLLESNAKWLRDWFDDLESRIESLAADSRFPNKRRAVTSWIEKDIDLLGAHQVMNANQPGSS